MSMRRFQRPLPVQYRTESCWREVQAVAMSRLQGSCMVLILLASPGGRECRRWVDRSCIRIDNPGCHD